MESKSYPVMEHFYSLQGEGANAGQAAYFIRLGGCDVGCTWCDVKDSWDASVHPHYNVDEMLKWVEEAGAPNVVITGGEPCMYNLEALTSIFKSNGVNLWLETSGAHPITGDWDWIVLSPKKFKACLDDSYKKAHELKVVLVQPREFKWAEQHEAQVGPDCALYLQPEWSKADKVQGAIIEYIKKRPQWSLSLQTHKYLDIR